jgi:hypothetical protein
MRKGQHGEPWEVDKNGNLVFHEWDGATDNGGILFETYGWDGPCCRTSPISHRAVACVNALDGCNPEAVEELLEAVRELAKSGYIVPGFDRTRKALSRL